MESNAQNPPFQNTIDYLSQLQNSSVDEGEERGVTKKPMDLRLVILLKFFRELYVRRSDLFDKLFPRLRGGLAEFMKRLEPMLTEERPMGRAKVRPVQRSLSVGSPRIQSRGLDEGCSGDLKPERFKVRTVDIDNGGGNPLGGQGGGLDGGGGKGGGGTKSGGSK